MPLSGSVSDGGFIGDEGVEWENPFEYERETYWLLGIKGYGVPRKLKCAGCQLGDHCNGEDDNCYCECTENAPSV